MPNRALGGKYGTALAAASVKGELEIAKFLLGRGANPDILGENTVQTFALLGLTKFQVASMVRHCKQRHLQETWR